MLGGPGKELGDVARRDGAVRAHVGAHVDPGVAAQRHDAPIALAEDLDLAVHLARVVGGEQVLAPVLGPLHRLAEPPRGERDQEIFRIELAAHAEATADVGLQHVDAVLGQIHVLRQHAARRERHLRRTGYRELGARAVPLRQQPARLHAHGGVALHGEALFAAVGRLHVQRIALGGRVGDGELALVAIDHRGQRLDVDVDRIGRVFGERGRVRHHHRDRLAYVVHFPGSNDRLLVRHELRQRREAQRDARHRAILRDVGRREDGVHAGHGACPCRVDGADAAVADVGAQDRGVQHALDVLVVDIGALAAQQAQILEALDGFADHLR